LPRVAYFKSASSYSVTEICLAGRISVVARAFVLPRLLLDYIATSTIRGAHVGMQRIRTLDLLACKTPSTQIASPGVAAGAALQRRSD
jgi:hypothetical protein